MRLINADALTERFKSSRKIWFNIDEVLDEISDASTVEPERKKGKWERHYSRPNVYADLYWHCSECGYKNNENYADLYHKFCPNCGADMRGEKDETD